MKKIFRISAVALLLCAAILLSSCSTILGPAVVNVVGKEREYRIQTTIHKLEVELYTARFTVCEGEEFKVVTNHNCVEAVDREGVLTVYEMRSQMSTLPDLGEVTVYLPKGMTLATVEIYCETGDVSLSALRAQTLSVESAVGALSLNGVYASDRTVLKSGMGSITLTSSALTNGEVTCTVGALNAYDTALLGNSLLYLGVGSATLELRGSAKDYTVSYVAGTGVATLDGEEMVAGESYGKGSAAIAIENGLGAVSLHFAD